MPAALVCFRDDLRLSDNPALSDALNEGMDIVPLFTWYAAEQCGEAPTGAARWWLHNALEDLDEALRERGSHMAFMKGPALDCILRAAKKSKARDVYWNRRDSPALARLDDKLEEQLREAGLRVHTSESANLHSAEALLHKGRHYRVFRPYYEAARKTSVRKSCSNAPNKLNASPFAGDGPVDTLGLSTHLNWTAGIRKTWAATRAGMELLLNELPFVVRDYDLWRDIPYRRATSRLSPYLRFGQISACELLQRVHSQCEQCPGMDAFVRQLYWREFARHILHYNPALPEKAMDERFDNICWREDPEQLARWQEGRTGFPIVDAGMRQLWQTGWMHNRVRMIAGSFLVKDLLMDWRKGAAWFMNTLVDADTANNSYGWQWVAGCGADAAPYFRVFNPVTQSRKFDPDGHYIRRFVPELANMPNKWIHAPWEAPLQELREAEVELGKDYPLPMLDHSKARERVLAAYKSAKTENNLHV